MAPFGVRQFRRFLVGCLSINVLMFLLSMMGSVLAGQFLGENALSGVALAAPFVVFGNFLVALIGAGTAINYSLRRGRLDLVGAESVFMQGVWLTLVLGVGTALGVHLLRDVFISLMGPTAEIAGYAREYWRWLPVGLFFMLVSGFEMSCCFCDGDTGFATAGMAVQFVVSLTATWLLLVCPSGAGLGASACSLGFAAGYAFSAALLACHFVRRSNTFGFALRFSFPDVCAIVLSSAGDALGFLGDALVYAGLGVVASRAFGESQLLLYPLFVFVSELCGYVNGFANAMQPIVAVYFGEGNLRSVRRTSLSIFRSLTFLSSAVTLLLLVFPGLVLSVVGIADSALASSGAHVVRAAAMMILPLTLLNLLNNYYQLIERPVLAVGMTVLCWLALPAVSLVSFPAFGSVGFWFWGAACRWGGAVIFAVFLLVRFGARRFPLLLDREREAAIETFDLRLSELEIAAVAEGVSRRMLSFGVKREIALRARLLVEETLMVVKERNAGKSVCAEVTLDFNDGIVITLRDDGVIFDITDADAKVNGLRTYLVATMMRHQSEKSNVLTTGFNRNVFRLA